MNDEDLRDLFAAHALTGIIANPQTCPENFNRELFALQAYKTADAMLEARKRETE